MSEQQITTAAILAASALGIFLTASSERIVHLPGVETHRELRLLARKLRLLVYICQMFFYAGFAWGLVLFVFSFFTSK